MDRIPSRTAICRATTPRRTRGWSRCPATRSLPRAALGPKCVEGGGSPARADMLTLRDPSFFRSILLEVGGTPVAQSRVRPAGVVEGLQILEDGTPGRLPGWELRPAKKTAALFGNPLSCLRVLLSRRSLLNSSRSSVVSPSRSPASIWCWRIRHPQGLVGDAELLGHLGHRLLRRTVEFGVRPTGGAHHIHDRACERFLFLGPSEAAQHLFEGFGPDLHDPREGIVELADGEQYAADDQRQRRDHKRVRQVALKPE
jgi:hypothetical protein